GFAGTRALTGTARVRVVWTGGDTLYGEIVQAATRGDPVRTPLQRAVASLVQVLLVGAAIVCVALALVRWLQGFGIVDALISALTLAVAALPEEFPVVLTFYLGVGVYRLARKRALVRRSVSVENIGRVTAICSDKTGTLTEGRLRIGHRVPADGLEEAELMRVAVGASRRESGDPLDLAIL
ncbi:MAG: cation-transporting P-type ATPase, partial [Myxococcales bacterium]|nr:cation-transporting P-type ATPase [Myxococcales bacterium]